MQKYQLIFDKRFEKSIKNVPKYLHAQIALNLEKLKKFYIAIKELDIKKLK
jgi:hypothetical protein